MRGSRVALLVCSAALLLSGCAGSTESLSAQWQGNAPAANAGDGATTSFPVEERGEAVEFSGVTEHGDTFGSADTLGAVTVVNFWYAGCAPCRAEAADLVAVHEEFRASGVQFVGVNTRDQRAQAVQFAEEFGVSYPSLMDTEGGREVQRAFAGQVPLNLVPTTLVLDAEGRVAHRVVGQLAGASQLRTLVKETLAESAE